MKAISLLQPWATLVVMGAKKIETRSWNTKYRGELIIHASKRRLPHFEIWFYNLCMSCGVDPYNCPQGAIVGKVNLEDTFSTERSLFVPNLQRNGQIWELTETEIAFGDYSEDRYGWLLSDPVQFDKPIPAKGCLGLWEYKGVL